MDSGIAPEWAEPVWHTLTAQRRDLLDVVDRTQVEEAFLADAALDWALVAQLLGRPYPDLRPALLEAGRALVGVHRKRGTAESLPVVRVDDIGLHATPPTIDNSLDSPERARTAYHLAGLTGDPELLARTSWPGGSAAEERALTALAAADPDGFLAALDEVLSGHAAPAPDPRVLISVPALGLAARALDQRLITAARLPAHSALPAELLGRDGNRPS